MEKKRRKLFKIVPDPKKKKVQFKYVKLIVFTQIICIFILVVGFNGILHLLLKTAQLGRYAETQIGNVFFLMNWLFAGVTVLSILIGGMLSLNLSHRFLGPLYRIELVLRKAIEEKKVPEFKLRQDDELHDFIKLLTSVSQ